MKLKNIVLALAFATLGLQMTACSGGGGAEAPIGTGRINITVGLILPDTTSDSAKILIDHANQYAAKNNAKLIIMPARTKKEVTEAISLASGQNCKGIILNASNSEFGDAARTQYEFFKLRVVTFGTRLQTNSGPEPKFMDEPFVGQDDESTGVDVSKFAQGELAKRGWKAADTSFVIIADSASKSEEALAQATREALEVELGLPKGIITIGKTPAASSAKSQAIVLSTSASSLNTYLSQWTTAGKSVDSICAVAIGQEATMNVVNSGSSAIYGTLLISLNKQFDKALGMVAAGIREEKKITTFPQFQTAEFVPKGSMPAEKDDVKGSEKK